jgi:hypothetical protein
MMAADGKKRRITAANSDGVLRLIQSIPSPKAEPFKAWLARVGSERIDETIDPELTIERALETYLKKGYSREWINQRIQAIQVRKELTDEWDNRGVKKGVEYAILTDEISKAWSGMTMRRYKELKGLKKENLRDNMTTLELVLGMLAEATTTEISKTEKPENFKEVAFTPVTSFHHALRHSQGRFLRTATQDLGPAGSRWLCCDFSEIGRYGWPSGTTRRLGSSCPPG